MHGRKDYSLLFSRSFLEFSIAKSGYMLSHQVIPGQKPAAMPDHE
jgi:hypothetical protein